ncbi:MAG: transpeptidase family protein [Bacteroidales bacterium]|nr:transpeptidase family protein [Bacteroidales bacterium]
MQVNIRKVGAFYLLFILLAMVAVGQIVNLQFINKPGRSYSKKTTREDVLPCTRGSILADDGRYLAFSIPEYRMGMDCVQPDSALFARNIDSLAICLAGFYKDKKAAQYKKEIVDRRKEGLQGGRRYLFLNRRLLTYQEMKEVSSFPILREGRGRGGRDEVKVDHRTYPYGRLGFRTLGYIKDQSEIPNIGIEGSCDSILRGTDGVQPMRLTEGRNWIVDTDRETIQPVDGLDVQLTIDIDLQDLAQNALINVLSKTNEVHAGTVVVMEVATGEIKAMVNLEKNGKGGFDETYNYAIGRKGEPGSVFKGATLTTLLEDKKLTIDTEVPAIVTWNYGGGAPFVDHYLDRYSTISVRRAYEISSNNVFRMLAARNYDKNPKEFLDKLTNERRITHDFPFELKGMAKANLKDPDVKTGRGAWNMKDLPQIAMGYTVEITPLHTLNFYNALANEGVMMRPHLVRNYQKDGEIVEQFKPEKLGNVCSKETAHEMWKVMRGVVESPGGTGYNIFKGCPVGVAGKTGTARIVFPNTGRYEDRAGHKMHQATFVGFFPSDAPKYSMIVVVYSEPTYNNFYGATWCGPVFRQVAEGIYASAIDWQDPLPRKGSLPKSDELLSFQGKEDIHKGLVPNVKGMGLREALALLEKSGYHVSFEGQGIVESQVPAAGDTARDLNITLKLKEQYLQHETE